MSESSPNLFNYHREIHPHRVAFLKSEGALFYSTESDKKMLHGFLILWTAHSIQMTKSVEYWIRSAGDRCLDLGYNSIGEKLKSHAKHEAGHEKMLENDLTILVSLWNQKFGGAMNLEELTSFDLLPSSKRYIQLHEEVIKSMTPFSQTAIEYEIERLSVTVAPRWVENILYTLGAEFKPCVTFLEEHILLDQGHTKFNTLLMEKCLTDSKTAEALVKSGSEAIQCYSDFLTECKRQAEKFFGQLF